MNLKTFEPLGGGVHQLNNTQNKPSMNLQLFADSTLNYNKVDNPYNFYLNKPTWVKGDIKKVYNLGGYYHKIPNYSTITTLPEENANYIKEALPNVTSCASMMGSFYDGSCKALTSIDTTGWDTSKVTYMTNMFSNCTSLTTLDVSKWNTSNVTDMNNMFYDCEALTTLDVSNWDTSKVTYMSYMFCFCYSLTALDVSKWNTSNVTGMSYMFSSCNSLTNLDISNWDTSKVTGMSKMFYNCSNLTTIKGIIDMKSCTSTSYGDMFKFSSNIKGVKIKNPPSGFTDTYASEISSGKIVIVQ